MGMLLKTSRVCGAVPESLDHGEKGRQAASWAHQRLVLGGQEHAGLHCNTAPKRYAYGAWALQGPFQRTTASSWSTAVCTCIRICGRMIHNMQR